MHSSVVIVKPGGTGSCRFVISARPAPLPPSSSFIAPLPSAVPSPKKYTPRARMPAPSFNPQWFNRLRPHPRQPTTPSRGPASIHPAPPPDPPPQFGNDLLHVRSERGGKARPLGIAPALA